ARLRRAGWRGSPASSIRREDAARPRRRDACATMAGRLVSGRQRPAPRLVSVLIVDLARRQWRRAISDRADAWFHGQAGQRRSVEEVEDFQERPGGATAAGNRL